jgi:hypothetical protein
MQPQISPFILFLFEWCADVKFLFCTPCSPAEARSSRRISFRWRNRLQLRPHHPILVTPPQRLGTHVANSMMLILFALAPLEMRFIH